MEKAILFSEIVEANGKTIKENNMVVQHTVPIGTLVEMKSDFTTGDYKEYYYNGLRLFVVSHDRDCDGSPLYSLSFDLTAAKISTDALNEINKLKQKTHLSDNEKGDLYINDVLYLQYKGKMLSGIGEESFVVIAPPPDESIFCTEK